MVNWWYIDGTCDTIYTTNIHTDPMGDSCIIPGGVPGEQNFYTVVFAVSRTMGVMAQYIWSRAAPWRCSWGAVCWYYKKRTEARDFENETWSPNHAAEVYNFHENRHLPTWFPSFPVWRQLPTAAARWICPSSGPSRCPWTISWPWPRSTAGSGPRAPFRTSSSWDHLGLGRGHGGWWGMGDGIGMVIL